MSSQLIDHLTTQHAAHRHLDAAGAVREHLTGDYDRSGQVNLPGYAGSLVAFATSSAAMALLARRTGHALPERFELRDLLVGGLATHKFSRLLSKGAVTAPVRAPFTEFEEAAGSSEHHESARGDRGLRHTVGELLTCPFCLGQWVSTGYVAGLVLAPAPTRAWAAVFAVTGISDALQQVYARLRTG